MTRFRLTRTGIAFDRPLKGRVAIGHVRSQGGCSSIGGAWRLAEPAD